MTDAKPKSPKHISLGWLVCGGVALGALLVPLAVYIAVGIYDTLYGSCALGAEPTRKLRVHPKNAGKTGILRRERPTFRRNFA